MSKVREVLYLISDSTGATVTTLAKSVTEQFTNIEFEKYFWPLVRSINQLDDITKEIEKKPGIVLYTILDAKVRDELKSRCDALNILCISPIGRIINDMENYLGISTDLDSSVKTYKNSGNYLRKIEAINYTINHDDGQMLETVDDADIIIIGVSRTSKTPTSFILGNRGLRTANIPYVHDIEFPINLKALPNNFIVALKIAAEVLLEIRKNRLDEFYGMYTANSNYANMKAIETEIKSANNFYLTNNIPVIDITGKAVEEVATEIFNRYLEWQGSHKIDDL